ncbi:MAG TPA: hypothetical protein VM513_11610 [Kofleriaceae bacterium]|nr:hypothetical protein [Kofleriaceae bacterium]
MRAALAAIALAGCYSPSPAPGSPCTAAGRCPEGLECRNDVCELPGVVGDDAARGDAADAPDACAGTCDGNTLLSCDQQVTVCSDGCTDLPVAHCKQLKPSNGITLALLEGTTANMSGDRWTFYTDTGQIRSGAQTVRAAGLGVISGINFQIVDEAGVFAMTSFSLPDNERLDTNGSRPLVLFAATTIDISGELDGSATVGQPGPGGSTSNTNTNVGSGCRGRAGRLLSTQHGEGGGGGGGATAGGNGGPSNAASPTGIGGELCASRSTTRPLRGGAAGGAGGASDLNSGGPGGGAVMLLALQSITISLTGSVSVSGGGGRSGAGGTVGSGEGGGGGGAGGAILLEARTITVNGALIANGGGGAAPRTDSGTNGSDNAITAAAGGTYTSNGGTAHGGAGGARNTGPGNGETYNYNDGLGTATSTWSLGGGGGGAVGRIELRAEMLDMPSNVISPAPMTNAPEYE